MIESQIPCDQRTLSYPWDEFHCGIFLANMESVRMYTLSCEILYSNMGCSGMKNKSLHFASTHTLRTHTKKKRTNSPSWQPYWQYGKIRGMNFILFDLYAIFFDLCDDLMQLLARSPSTSPTVGRWVSIELLNTTRQSDRRSREKESEYLLVCGCRMIISILGENYRDFRDSRCFHST